MRKKLLNTFLKVLLILKCLGNIDTSTMLKRNVPGDTIITIIIGKTGSLGRDRQTLLLQLPHLTGSNSQIILDRYIENTTFC